MSREENSKGVNERVHQILHQMSYLEGTLEKLREELAFWQERKWYLDHWDDKVWTVWKKEEDTNQ